MYILFHSYEALLKHPIYYLAEIKSLRGYTMYYWIKTIFVAWKEGVVA
jgi:hypothetical protein